MWFSRLKVLWSWNCWQCLCLNILPTYSLVSQFQSIGVSELRSAIPCGLLEWKINSVHWTAGSLCDSRSFRWSWCLSIWILQGIDLYLQKFMVSERRYKKHAGNERIELKNTVLDVIYYFFLLQFLSATCWICSFIKFK